MDEKGTAATALRLGRFVDQERIALRIYSCHHLPALFSGEGNRLKGLRLIPVDALNRDEIVQDLQAAASHPDKPAQLRIIYLATLAANESLEERNSAMTQIAKQCSKTLRDIAAKTNDEYYFTLDDEVFTVAAGSGSVKTYRHNLAKRFLKHSQTYSGCFATERREIVTAEFRIYETLYLDLSNLGVGEIALAETVYRQLAKELGR